MPAELLASETGSVSDIRLRGVGTSVLVNKTRIALLLVAERRGFGCARAQLENFVEIGVVRTDGESAVNGEIFSTPLNSRTVIIEQSIATSSFSVFGGQNFAKRGRYIGVFELSALKNSYIIGSN